MHSVKLAGIVVRWFALILLFSTHSGYAQESSSPNAETKPWMWAVNIQPRLENYESANSDDNELKGVAAAIQFGGAYCATHWAALGSFDILLGPYTTAREENIKTDFFGTGVSLSSVYALNRSGVRSEGGSFGLGLGFQYLDLVGRAIAKGSAENPSREIDNYVIRSQFVQIVPALFFASLKPARTKGNTPEQLMTRLEGYMISLGFGYPVYSSYGAKYLKITTDGKDANTTQNVKEKGSFNGYSLVLGIDFFLGV